MDVIQTQVRLSVLKLYEEFCSTSKDEKIEKDYEIFNVCWKAYAISMRKIVKCQVMKVHWCLNEL